MEKPCKGILFEYENGSKRALGQCRLGLDEVRSWYKPLSLHYAVSEVQWTVDQHHPLDPFETSIGALVIFDSESKHMSEDGTLERNYYELKGRLIVWFALNAADLQLVDD